MMSANFRYIVIVSLLLLLFGSFLSSLSLEAQTSFRKTGSFDFVLKGDTTCSYQNVECTPCITNLSKQLEDLSPTTEVYRFPSQKDGLKLNLFGHPQGIARIPNCQSENWFVIPKNHPRSESEAGVLSIRFPTDKSHAGIPSQFTGELGDIVHFYSTEDNIHPGGCQIVGQYLAVAHEGTSNDLDYPGWISLYDVSDPEGIEECNRLIFNGEDVNGNRYAMTANGQADCVGISKLENGHYLMFALESRRRSSVDVGWFFISTSTDIKTTEWEYLQFWTQEDLIPSKKELRTYENIALVTECTTGNICLLGYYGNGRSNGIDVFGLELNSEGVITIEKLFDKKIKTRAKGATFRAGASIYVNSDREIVLYSIEKTPSDNMLLIEEFR